MYRSFYKLKKKPFQISSDPEFLWMSDKHKEALAILNYGIQDNKGFLLLTGDVGTGKTTLINALLDSLDGDTLVSTIHDPKLSVIDFFNIITFSFNLKARFKSKGDFVIWFTAFLNEAYNFKKKVLLIIDEAQLLNSELLDEIRLLSNIEKNHTKLVNIFFVGQGEFNDILLKNENRPVRQRITLNYNIEALTEMETDQYIKHRLKIAGTEDEIFEWGSVQEIYNYTKGYPRQINVLCDHALLTGYVKGARHIDRETIRECTNELTISQTILYEDYEPETEVSVQYEDILEFGNRKSVDIAEESEMLEETNDEILSQNPGNNQNILKAIIAVLVGLIILFVLFPETFSNVSSFFDTKFAKTEDLSIVSPENRASVNLDTEMEVTENYSVFFKTGSIEISDTDNLKIRKIAYVLKQKPSSKAKIYAYINNNDPANFNEKLAQFRADIVEKSLMENGVNLSQILSVEKKQEETIFENDIKDPRVEIKIVE